MEFLGKLTAKESTFDKTQRVVTSEKLGIVVKLNVNDFETDEQCEELAILISKAPEMLEMLQKCKEYFLLKKDSKSEERADAIGQLIKEATEL
jgi:hypothetical protein